MKKLIAISVVFALIAGTAFAADIGVEVIGQADIIKGDTGKDYAKDVDGNVISTSHKVGAGGWPGGLKRTRITATGENDDGTFGGHFRLEKYGVGDGIGIDGNAWWKPVEQVRFRLGNNPDGDFAADGVTRWGFYQVAGDVGVPKEDFGFGASFYGGWGENGGLLTLTPTEGLEINLGVPFSNGDEMKYVYLSSTLQIAYTAEGLGKFALTYKSGKGNVAAVDGTASAGDATWGWVLNDDDDPSAGVTWGQISDGAGALGSRKAIHDPGKLWLYAGLTMIENLSIDIGLGYKLPYTGEGIEIGKDDSWDGEKHTMGKGSINEPIAIGFGAHYNAGDFGVKGRLQVKLAGKVAAEGLDAYKVPMNIRFDALPYYNINDNMTFLFSLGVDYTMKSSNEVDKDGSYAKMGFHVTPYISIKGGSNWHPNFFAGLDVRTDGTKIEDGSESKDGSSVMSWSVPIGIAFAF